MMVGNIMIDSKSHIAWGVHSLHVIEMTVTIEVKGAESVQFPTYSSALTYAYFTTLSTLFAMILKFSCK